MTNAHDPAHRHERAWYYDKEDWMLSHITQWLPSCRACHTHVDQHISKEEREDIFLELRGEEVFERAEIL